MPRKQPISEPYPGPRPFTKNERGIFFGRDEEVADLRNHCMSYQVVVLYSQSGAGKSSLVKAGLRPALLRRCVRILPVARVKGLTGELAEATKENIYIHNALTTLFGGQADPSRSLADNLSRLLFHGNPDQPRAHAIIFDQFEELFTAYPDRWREREGFFSQVSEALEADPELRALFVLREERLADLDNYSDLVPTNFRIRYRLERLKEDAARQAIQEPLKRFGWYISPEKANELIGNLRQIKVRRGMTIAEAEGEYIEPVHLQVVCQNMWRKRDESQSPIDIPEEKRAAKVLSVPADVKDIDNALAAYYDAAVKNTAKKGLASERKIRNWFDRELITPGGTRGFVYRTAGGADDTAGLPNPALDSLEGEHVIRSEPRGTSELFEITHDRFVAPIKRSNSLWRAKRRRVLLPIYLVLLVLLGFALYKIGQSTIENKKRAREQKDREETVKHATDCAFRAEAIAMQASEAFQRGKVKESREKWPDSCSNYEAAVNDFKKLERGVQPDLYLPIAEAYSQCGRVDQAKQFYQQALDSVEHQDVSAEEKLQELGRDHLALGKVLLRAGETSAAQQELEKAQEAFKKQKVPRNMLEVQSLLAEAHLRKGEFSKAKDIYENSVDLLTSIADFPELFNEILGLIKVEGQSGHYEDALTEYEGISADMEKDDTFKNLRLPGDFLREAAFDQLHLGLYGPALQSLKRAEERAQQEQDVEQQASVALLYAEYYLERPHHSLDQAGAWAQDAKKKFQELHDPVMSAAANTYLARVDIEQNKLDQARSYLDEALQVQRNAERKIGEAYALQAMGMLEEAQGNPEEANKQYAASYCVYKSIKVADGHRHYNEVKVRLLALHVKLPTACPK